jgi:hypothetical protein
MVGRKWYLPTGPATGPDTDPLPPFFVSQHQKEFGIKSNNEPITVRKCSCSSFLDLIPNCYGNNIALSSYHSKFLWDDDSCVVACISLNSLLPLPVPPTSNPDNCSFRKYLWMSEYILEKTDHDRYGNIIVRTVWLSKTAIILHTLHDEVKQPSSHHVPLPDPRTRPVHHAWNIKENVDA